MTVKRIVVIGAGIIGVTCAYELSANAFDVVVIDPDDHDSAPSRANAGALAYAEVLPIASGRIVRKVPRWLLDPLGPLSIRLSYLHRVAPWLTRFVLAGREKTVRNTGAALAALNILSRQSYAAIYAAAELTNAVRPVGALHLYENEQEFRRALPGWSVRAEHRLKFEHIGQADLLAMEPALSPMFTHGTLIDDWDLVSDPKMVLDGITRAARNRGVEFTRDTATGVYSHDSALQVSLQHGAKPVVADKVVLAAGAWSGPLAKKLGDRIPVEAERGYNTTISDPQVAITRELIFGEHGFVATQLDCGLRIGGGAEFAGLDEPPNYARADAMLTKAKRFLPGLKAHQGVKWMGCRPSMPDYRPVIGPSPSHPHVLYAFGHGHLGLTQAAGTAKLIAQLALGLQPDINIEPYSPNRFT